MTEAFAITETAARSNPFLLNTATACYKDVGYDFYLKKINSVTVLQYEPRREKTGLRGLRPGATQTGLYSHKIRLGA